MSSKLSRRDFAKGAALAVTVAATVPADLLSQSEKPEAKPPQGPPSASPPTSPQLSPAAKAEAQQCYQALMRKYSSRFTEEQKKDIARLLEQQQKAVESLRAFVLENGDEPATVLRLYVRAEDARATR